MRNDELLGRRGAAVEDSEFAGEWLRDLASNLRLGCLMRESIYEPLNMDSN